MEFLWKFGLILSVIVLGSPPSTIGQVPGSNVPNNPYWPLFSELLSKQTGRTVQDINILGLSDPVISTLWANYTASMPTLGLSAPPPTTPPPLPDVYQPSYSFSSSGAAASSSSPSTGSTSGSNTNLVNDLLGLLSQSGATGGATSSYTPQSASSPGSGGTSTSINDIIAAYQQMMPPSPGSPNPMQLSMTSPTGGTTDIMSQLQSMMSGATAPSQTSSSTGPTQTSYQALMDQYNALMGGNQGSPTTTGGTFGGTSGGTFGSTTGGTTGGTIDYAQLLQQYNQIMAGATTGGATGSTTNSVTGGAGSTSSSTPGGSLYEQMLAQYNQMMANSATSTTTNSQQQPQQPTSMNPATSPDPASTPSAPSSQMTVEEQLKTYFPQFTSLFPSSPSTSAGSSATDPAPSPDGNSNMTSAQTTQAIFDALLFGPKPPATNAGSTGNTGSTGGTGSTAPAGSSSTPTSTAKPSTGNVLQTLQNSLNMVQPPKSGPSGGNILVNHMDNVFKARAAREMGCRFLPELLELDLHPTAPLNCMNKCIFPYLKALRFGAFCVCCPPGMNEQVIGMMSLMRRAKYMESPMRVVS